MADQQVQKPAQEALPQVEEEVVVTDVAQADDKTTSTTTTTTVEKELPPPVPETEEEKKEEEAEVPMKPKHVDQEPLDTVDHDHMAKSSDGDVHDHDDDGKIDQSGSFKEESTRVADLPDNEKKALQEFKQLVQEALNKHEFFSTTSTPPLPPPPPPPKEEENNKEAVAAEENKATEEEDDEKKPVQEQITEPVGSVPVPVCDEPEKEPVAAVDDDGAKTVEAIEETIVAVSSSTLPEEKSSPSKAANHDQCDDDVAVPAEEVSIWGIPLLSDERSDVILLKFLRARDFKVKEAFTMLKNTVRWRKEFGIEELVEQELGNDDDLKKVVFMSGFDKEGHPVCYNVYGEFQNKEVYQKTFCDEEKRQNFLRWRIQFLEKSIRKLDFSPGGICTIVQVNDLKNSPGPAKRELRQATKQALQLLQDNYPEFVAKQVFINVPWWYLTVNRMISPFLTQRTRSKFVFAGPSKSAETLFRYIAGEQVPVKYGGLSKDGEFATTDAVTEITVRPAAKHTVEFPVTETCLLTWEVRVVGWDVSYGAEFVPNAEESYTVIIQKARRVASNEEPVVCNSFKIGEPGKVVLSIDNPSSKKKKLLYRLKTKASLE